MSHWNRRQLLQGASASLCLGCAPAPLPGAGLRPELAPDLRQVMVPWVAADDGLDGRLILHNAIEASTRVVVQIFDQRGRLVVKQVVADAMAPGVLIPITLSALLREHDVPTPFGGSLWVGTRPSEGTASMGLQGVSYTWLGATHRSSIHALRDFGNPNRDTVWTDLIHPRVVNTDRMVTAIAIGNASGDGLSEPLIARPELVLRDDTGVEQVRVRLPELPPYAATLVSIDTLAGGEALTQASAQLLEPHCGLVAYALLLDRERGSFVSADHLTDRHFAVALGAERR